MCMGNVAYQISASEVKNCGVGVNFMWPYSIALAGVLPHMFGWHFWLARWANRDSWVGQGVNCAMGKVDKVFLVGHMGQVDQVGQVGQWVSSFNRAGLVTWVKWESRSEGVWKDPPV